MKYDKKTGFSDYIRKDQIEKNVAYVTPVSSNNLELYAVYALVRERSGYCSFEELRTDPKTGITHDTFEEAARKMGIIEEDKEWDNLLTMASKFALAYHCRALFASILANCAPPDPLGLWEKHKKCMMDPTKNPSITERIREQRALKHIKSMLKANGKKYKNYNLPKLEADPFHDAQLQEQAKDAEEKLREMTPLLTMEQANIIADITTCIQDDSCTERLYCVTGSGGCGKTFIYKYIYYWSVYHGKKLACCAYTGIAATLLPNGLTAQ